MVKISVDDKTGLNYREGTLDLFVIREQSTYKKLMKYVKGKRVLDIGGNIGAFAYTALENGAVKVDSFEPDASNIKMYKKQGLDSTLYEYAVTDRDGKAKFYLNSGKNKGMHTLRETRGREFVEVKTISFEKVLKKCKPQVLKIDIEGGEYGLDFDLIPDTVKVIAVEIHLTSVDQRREGKKLLKYLKERYEELTDSKITEKNWTTLFIGRL
jgi:FkbM family methyltransferase